PLPVAALPNLLSEVMAPTRRSTVGLQFTRRFARTERLALSPEERQLYDAVTALVRQHLPKAGGKTTLTRMALVLLQMALGSSGPAAAAMLENMAENTNLPAELRRTLAELAEQARWLLAGSKTERLLRLLDEFPDKMVVFTQFRATQAMLEQRLVAAGHEVAVFHGGLARLQKEAAIERFRRSARMLLATEAGSE